MSYNSSTKTITAPVSIQDVQQALNVNNKDLKDLCTSSSVNMWAKFKPVSFNAVVPITYDNRRSTTPSDNTQLNRYGLETIRCHSASFNTFFTKIKNAIMSSNSGYTWGVKYIKPTGGSSSPYRLSDFVQQDSEFGYRHDAALQFTPCNSNYSLALTFTPETDGYSIAKPMPSIIVDSSTSISIVGTAQEREQEMTAWNAFDPTLPLSSYQNTVKYLSVSIFDLLCSTPEEKTTVRNMNRGFLITNGSSVVHWSVGSIPFGSWLNTIEGGLITTGDDFWYFAEFYTNAPVGNYADNVSAQYTYILIPGALGKLKISSGTTVVAFRTLVLGHVDTNGTSSPGYNKVEASVTCLEKYKLSEFTGVKISVEIDDKGNPQSADYEAGTSVEHAIDYNNPDEGDSTFIAYINNGLAYIGHTIHMTVTGIKNGNTYTFLEEDGEVY